MNYPLVFYVDALPKTFGGVTYGPIILILERLRNDEGIRQHELTHVKQWVCTLGLLGLFYYFIPKFRLWCEVQAYKKQMKYYADDRSWRFAGSIATKYRLDITQEQAHQLLKE